MSNIACLQEISPAGLIRWLDQLTDSSSYVTSAAPAIPRISETARRDTPGRD